MNQSDILKHLKRCEEIADGQVIVEIEEKEPLYIRLIDAAILLVVLLCLGGLLSTWSNANANEAAEQHKAAAGRYSAMLATCLNGGTLYDKTSNTAIFCGKAIELVNP